MNFKQFLEKNRLYDDWCERDDYKTDSISIKTLGEWAFQKAYKSGGFGLEDDSFYVYRSIALACLGEKQVKKRLEELK